MAQRVLRCLEGAPAAQYGPLLLLLSRRLMTSHHLVVADEVIRLACRSVRRRHWDGSCTNTSLPRRCSVRYTIHVPQHPAIV